MFAFLENKCGKNVRKQDWRNIEEIQSSTQDMACESAPGGREKKNSVSIVSLSSFALVGSSAEFFSDLTGSLFPGYARNNLLRFPNKVDDDH